MTNADLFRTVFNGLMATELWAKSESEFLEWLNAEAVPNKMADKKAKNEQRLLCLDEIENLKCGDWVWIECADSERYPGGSFYCCELDDDAETIEDPYKHTVLYFHGLAGCERFDTAQDGWRLWTDKPTKKLAKSTKWNMIK